MARTLEQIIAGLPEHRRKNIEDRAAELMTLRNLRQARHKTQEDLATALHKDEAIQFRCNRVAEQTGQQWRFTRIKQKDANLDNAATLADLLGEGRQRMTQGRLV